MKLHIFLLLIVILIVVSCTGNAKKAGVYVKKCCLDSLEYSLVDSAFSSPSSIILKLAHCDSVSRTTISSVLFHHVQVLDSSYFDVWAAETESIQSPNTIFVYIHTNNFEKSNLSKDSIENLLSKQIELVTSKNDTIYIKRCPKDPVQ